MKKFILSILYFCLPVVILSIPIDFFLSKKLKELNNFAHGENLVWEDIYNNRLNKDLLIYGSSRAWVHINPDKIQCELGLTAYNLGIDGLSFKHQYLRHEILLQNNSKPKIILYSVDINTLVKQKGLYNYVQFLPYMLYNPIIRQYTSDYNIFNKFDYYIPLVRYYGESETINIAIKNMFLSSYKEPTRINGFKGQKRKWNSDLSNAKNKIFNYNIEIDKETVENFKNFVKNANLNNIKIILIYTPEYIEGQKFVKNRKEIISIFNKIALKNNIPFLNYSTDELSYNKEYFYNSLHLNNNGANLFTEKLIEDLKPIINN